jgi:hypothetical protein
MLQQDLSFLLEPLAFINRRNIPQQVLQKIVHVLLECASLSRRERYHQGIVGIFEVVYVAMIVEVSLPLLKILEHPLDRGRSTGSRKSCYKNVVTKMVHFQSHLERT